MLVDVLLLARSMVQFGVQSMYSILTVLIDIYSIGRRMGCYCSDMVNSWNREHFE